MLVLTAVGVCLGTVDRGRGRLPPAMAAHAGLNGPVMALVWIAPLLEG